MSTGAPPPPPSPGSPQDGRPNTFPGGDRRAARQPYRSPYPSPYGGYAAREHPQGTTILVLGILSLVVCGLLGPVAWVMGNTALGEIDRDPVPSTNRGTVEAGRICGIIATGFLALALVGAVAALLLVAAGS